MSIESIVEIMALGEPFWDNTVGRESLGGFKNLNNLSFSKYYVYFEQLVNPSIITALVFTLENNTSSILKTDNISLCESTERYPPFY